MAQTVGVSKSAVSRQGIEASEQTLKELCERRFDDQDILIVYLDGIQFGQVHVIVALGVDREGHKHVLGLREGATENATVVKDLLTDIVARGLDPKRKRLFVIDGGKALRAAIDEVFGDKNPVQRCRNHKIRNVLGYLPKDRQEDVRAAMKAAFRRGSPSSRSWPSGWSMNTLRPHRACWRGSRRCSRSTAWSCPAICGGAWGRPT